MSLGVMDLGHGPKESVLNLGEDLKIPKGYLNHILFFLVVWGKLEENSN